MAGDRPGPMGVVYVVEEARAGDPLERRDAAGAGDLSAPTCSSARHPRAQRSSVCQSRP
jgi:hypothetical protein